jgi:hypothetical protein
LDLFRLPIPRQYPQRVPALPSQNFLILIPFSGPKHRQRQQQIPKSFLAIETTRNKFAAHSADKRPRPVLVRDEVLHHLNQ